MVVVFDCNVLISASIFWNSIPALALRKARKENDLIIFSTSVLSEIKSTILSDKFDKYISLTNRIDFFEALKKESTDIKITEKILACRDSKDNKYLELAVSGNAGCIVTGDADLLVLHPFRGISIITPKDFLKLKV